MSADTRKRDPRDSIQTILDLDALDNPPTIEDAARHVAWLARATHLIALGTVAFTDEHQAEQEDVEVLADLLSVLWTASEKVSGMATAGAKKSEAA